MALNVTQVNAAYVALLGRAAEGSAANWAGGFTSDAELAQTILSIDDSFKNDVERKATNADFVKALYTELLGKEGDSEGQTFWLNALNAGLSREEVKLQFINAAKANNENLSAFYADNELFVNDVYGNLLGRGADSDGLRFWADALNNGASKASVIANIIAAIQANPTSEDFKTFSAKMAVADTVSASFSGFKAGLNTEQKAAALETMKQIIESTTADVKPTDETIKTSIDNLVGNYEKETLYNFRVSEESYDLGNAESTNSQTFRGTINLVNADKSTYTDKASVKTGKYSDSLIIDVVSNQANKTLDASTIKAVPGIDSLTINNGTADVTNLSSNGFSQNIKVTGAADVSGSVSTALNYLEVSTGANKTANIAVNANLNEYKALGTGNDVVTISGDTTVAVNKIDTGAGNDTVNVNASGSITGTLDTGNGDDVVTVSGTGATIAGATINLGSGNDLVTLASGTVSGATIDGGAGTDTLKLSVDAKGVTFSNFEIIETASSNAEVSYAQIKNGITIKASSNALKVDASKESDINLSKVVAGTENGGDKITLSSVGNGATVTLNANDKIAETITAADYTGKITVNGVVKGEDSIDLKAVQAITNVATGNWDAYTSGGTQQITDTKAYLVTDLVATKSSSTLAADDVKALFTANSSATGVAAVQVSDGIVFYKVVDSGSTITATTLDVALLGTGINTLENTSITIA